MGSVTKTMIETSGEMQCSTTLHFDSFEDFMKYELVVVGDSGKTFTKDEIDINLNLNTSVDNTNNPKKIKVGEYYRVVGNKCGHELPLGSVVKVIDSLALGGFTKIVYKAQHLDGKDWWWVDAEDLEEYSE